MNILNKFREIKFDNKINLIKNLLKLIKNNKRYK